MRFVALLIILLLPLNVFAQNTQTPDVSALAPTVSLEIKVVQVILNDEHRQGVDWEAIVSDFHNLQLKDENDPFRIYKEFRLSVGDVSNEDFAVLLDALDTVGPMSQKDFPQVALNKGEPKMVDLSVDRKFLSVIHLNLMCFNSPSGELKLRIGPAIDVKEDGKPGGVVAFTGQTEVDLKDSRTVVIGGLMHEEGITKTHKFPLLGDLPLVGLVFRKQGRLMQKTETIVFLTMHTGVTTGEQK